MHSDAFPNADPTVGAEIEQTLLRTIDLWNAHDIDGFLTGYEDAPTTCFVRADHVLRGFAAIRDMYVSSYAAGDGGKMGRLSLDTLETRKIGFDHAFAIGRFHLTRSAEQGGDASGYFSLLLRKIGEDWKIIVDHTP